MWLQGVGIGARARHLFVVGSYSSTVPRDRCGWRGRITGVPAAGIGPAPPITQIFPFTTGATLAPRVVGIGARACPLSVAGSYSQESLTGFQPGRPAQRTSK